MMVMNYVSYHCYVVVQFSGVLCPRCSSTVGFVSGLPDLACKCLFHQLD